MPPVVRVTDIAAGHASFSPTPAQVGSPDTYYNSLQAHRVGDAVVSHSSLSPAPPHPRKAAVGSPDTYINGSNAVRLGDAVDCGGLFVTGSSDIFIN